MKMPQSPRMKQPTSHAEAASPRGTQKNPPKKTPKRGSKNDDPPSDDESVDEHGNIRGLIDDESEAESEHSELSLSPSERATLKKTGRLPSRIREQIRSGGRRKAAILAEERIRKKLKKKL